MENDNKRETTAEEAATHGEKASWKEETDGEYMEPLPPVRIGVDEWCFHNSMMIGRMDLERVIQAAGEMGVEGIGFDYFMMTKEMRADPGRVRELLKSNNLGLVFGFGVPFALPELVLQALEGRKDEMFDLARELGCDTLRVCGGVIIPNMFHKPFHIVFDREKEIKDVARKLRVFTEDAALEGLTVAMENHTDYTLAEMLEIIERVDHNNFKITLDTGNALYMKEDPVETAERLAQFTAYTHIKDMAHQGPFLMSVPLGEGEIDLPSIINTLREHNYEGFYSIEVDLPLWKVDKEEDSLRDSIEYLRRFRD